MNCTRGFTYLEVLIAIVLLAGAALTASEALIGVRVRDEGAAMLATAQHLLQDGVAIVSRLPRIDDDTPVFGRESNEAPITGTDDLGMVADDVDDLNGVVQTGPTDLSGLPHSGSWKRIWRVDSVDLVNPQLDRAPGSTPLMRVRIDIEHDGSALATTTILLARTP